MLDRRVERIDKMFSGLIRHQKVNGVKRVAVRPWSMSICITLRLTP